MLKTQSFPTLQWHHVCGCDASDRTFSDQHHLNYHVDFEKFVKKKLRVQGRW